MTTGRPTKYCQELADEICRRICNGESLASICKDTHMPERQNVWVWRTKNPEFRDMCATAIQIKGEGVVDSMDEIEEQMIRGEIEGSVGNAILGNRRWKASKFYIRVFGDKTQTENVTTNLNINTEVKLSDADLAILSRFGFNND